MNRMKPRLIIDAVMLIGPNKYEVWSNLDARGNLCIGLARLQPVTEELTSGGRLSYATCISLPCLKFDRRGAVHEIIHRVWIEILEAVNRLDKKEL